MKGDDNLKPFQQAVYGLIRQKGFPVNGSRKYSRVLRIDEEYKEEFIELYKLVLNTVEEIGHREGRPAADAKDQVEEAATQHAGAGAVNGAATPVTAVNENRAGNVATPEAMNINASVEARTDSTRFQVGNGRNKKKTTEEVIAEIKNKRGRVARNKK